MTTFQNVIDCCDAAIQAAKGLEEAKSVLVSEEANYRKLVDEKTGLQRDVDELKAEKDDLEARIAAFYVEASEPRSDLVEKKDEHTDEHTDDTNLPTCAVSGVSGGSAVSPRRPHLQREAKDAALASRLAKLEEERGKRGGLGGRSDVWVGCCVTSPPSGVTAPSEISASVLSEELLDFGDGDGHTSTARDLFGSDASDDEDEEQDDLTDPDTTPTDDAAGSDSGERAIGAPRTPASKRRVARASYNSPKKWRRMIRTHRLQSILLREFH